MRLAKAQPFTAARGSLPSVVLLFLLLALGDSVKAYSASFTATLDRSTVAVGETATLTLSVEGGQPNGWPAIPQQPNLQIVPAGTSRNVDVVQGKITSTLSQQYLLIPMQAGSYKIPALAVMVDGAQLTSPALSLTAVRASGAAGDTNQPLALMRIFMPRKEVYAGEALAVELQVLVREGVLNAEDILRAFDGYGGTPISTEGSRVLRTAHANRRGAQLGGANYIVSTLVTAITPVKTGLITIKSIEVPLTAQLPVPGQRRRDIFDPFGMFQQTRDYRIVLSAEPVELNVMPLPAEGRPADFNGAVGSFAMTMDAGPTNVAAGDPITVRIRIEGKGDLESLALPEPVQWRDFKTYPPSASIESKDPLQLSGTKRFEQVVVPQVPDIKDLPGISFSFFDPEKKTYETIKSPAIALIVRPGGSTPAPLAATPRQVQEENKPPTPDIVPIKRRLAGSADLQQALILTPWFLALELIPVALLAGALIYRRRTEAEARNPRLRRRRQVEKTIRAGLADLRQLGYQNKSEDFFSTLFRLLQDRIAERLNVPSSSITEAVIEERLRPAGVSEELLKELAELFQACNLARYAPVQSTQELQTLVLKAENVLSELGKLEL